MTSDSKPQWRSHPPFYAHLGLELEALADGKSAIRLPFRKEYGNTRGEVHGGAIATLVDAAMSQAVRSTVEQGARVATITMTVNYLAPAVGDVLCRGTIVRGGRSLMFVEAEVLDSSGALVCRASATFRAAAAKPAKA
jgi:uncharacterized protein (TIGR00369 family)